MVSLTRVYVWWGLHNVILGKVISNGWSLSAFLIFVEGLQNFLLFLVSCWPISSHFSAFMATIVLSRSWPSLGCSSSSLVTCLIFYEVDICGLGGNSYIIEFLPSFWGPVAAWYSWRIILPMSSRSRWELVSNETSFSSRCLKPTSEVTRVCKPWRTLRPPVQLNCPCNSEEVRCIWFCRCWWWQKCFWWWQN